MDVQMREEKEERDKILVYIGLPMPPDAVGAEQQKEILQ